MTPAAAVVLSLVLLALNGFFVAAEFAVVSAKRHRLEAVAARGNPAARAAVRNSRELSLMLAGAQLGITLCTLGLGALAKPAVAELVEPLLGAAGVPRQAAAVVAVLVAVALVVFLHMVVGEMAPKSWAISHPERSALLLARPFRGFVWASRPMLSALNGLANGCLRAVKVDPVDERTTVLGPVELQLLLTSSREHGLIEAADEQLLSNVIDLRQTPVYAVTLPIADAVSVPATATVGEVEQASRASGRSRLVVLGSGGPAGVVHVRDAVTSPEEQARGGPVTARDLAYPVPRLSPHDSLVDAIATLRAARAQLAFVAESGRGVVGLVALEDLLERVLGPFKDETDR